MDNYNYYGVEIMDNYNEYADSMKAFYEEALELGSSKEQIVKDLQEGYVEIKAILTSLYKDIDIASNYDKKEAIDKIGGLRYKNAKQFIKEAKELNESFNKKDKFDVIQKSLVMAEEYSKELGTDELLYIITDTIRLSSILSYKYAPKITKQLDKAINKFYNERGLV